MTAPIDMILHCPVCHMQHIDAPAPAAPARHYDELPGGMRENQPWHNPPHRSHLCLGCGHIWRPADVPTNGVAAIKTRGKADSPPPKWENVPPAQVLEDMRANFERLAALRPDLVMRWTDGTATIMFPVSLK